MKQTPAVVDVGAADQIAPQFAGHDHRRHLKLGQILAEQGVLTEEELADSLREQAATRSRRIGDFLVQKRHANREAIESTLNKGARGLRSYETTRVGELLVAAGLLTREKLLESLAVLDREKKERLGALLIRKGVISEEQLLRALAQKFDLRFVDLGEMPPSPAAQKLIAGPLAARMQVVPVELRGKTLVIATADPTDPLLEEALRFHAGCAIELVAATGRQICEFRQKCQIEDHGRVDTLIEELVETLEVADEKPDSDQVDESDSAVIRLVNKVLLTSVSKRASDIHFEPGPGQAGLDIRFRVDGECGHACRIPAVYKNAVISRLKILSNLDIAERRKPQSGKIFLKSGDQRLEYRVEITPTAGGQEDAVLRVLSAAQIYPIDQIGFSARNLERMRGVLKKPYGLILCVGPTGSGKTTTLHSALGHINSPKRKIWTAEDPVEISQPGLRQVQVNRKIGLTFSEALRSFLRADPDVIMVGEMRDPETARIAVEASLTGHLVFSTLHTNSAAETINRLLQMGIDPLHFADALLGILAQRLVLKLCSHCREPYRPSQEEYDRLIRSYGQELAAVDRLPPCLEKLTLMRRKGCGKCGGTGYFGRIAIHELLEGTAGMQQLIIDRQPVAEMRRTAIEDGMRPLRLDGILKVFEGITDFEQILKTCV
jgi:type II secretory ATPase GspE/PulE/Tfp pilus assembly ATPase PilB-like protein